MRKNKKSKIFSAAILSLAILGNTLFSASGYSDIQSHWNQEKILKWKDSAVISGYSDGSFRPDNSTTRAEFSAVVCRILGLSPAASAEQLFSDIAADAWYAQFAGRLYEMGILSDYADGTFRPEQNMTRQEAAVALAKAFEVTGTDEAALSRFSDRQNVASWAAEGLAALVENGYMSGSENRLRANSSITRAELMTLIDKLAGGIWKAAGNAAFLQVQGNLVVNLASAMLQDLTVQGDLYLTQGIGSGDVTLENVNIQGRLIVLGGGENSIHLKGCAVGGQLVVNDRQNRVRIVVDKNTRIPSALVKSGVKLQNDGTEDAVGQVELRTTEVDAHIRLSGSFGEVTAAQAGQKVVLGSGSIRNLRIDGQASITVASDASIKTLQVYAPAQIFGSGRIESASIASEGVSSEITPENVTVGSSFTATIGGRTVSVGNASGSSSTGGNPTGGSSSGGSPSDGSPSDGSPSDSGSSDGGQQSSFVKSSKVVTVGAVRYISIAFSTGSRTDYTYIIDGKNVSTEFTNVTDTGSVVKYELLPGQKTLVIKDSVGLQQTIPLE